MEEYHTEGLKDRRVYATGDLAKLQPDGTIVYVGRADTQVKMNGQRVELGDVESNLALSADGPLQFVCEFMPMSGMQGRKMLVAFLSYEFYRNPTTLADTSLLQLTSELKESLVQLDTKAKEILAPHMVPGLYVPLRAFPETLSGKLDRKALRELAESLPSATIEEYAIAFAAVRTLESSGQFSLRAMWCAILKILHARVGADSNFVSLGGDSIAAMQLVSKAAAQGLGITVAEVFQHPRLGDMASSMKCIVPMKARNFEQYELCPRNHLESILKDAETQCKVSRTMFEDVYPATRLQEGLLAMTALQQDAYVNRTVFKIPGNIELVALQKAWECVAKRHSILRTRLFASSVSERYM